jgi:hypothetical protein
MSAVIPPKQVKRLPPSLRIAPTVSTETSPSIDSALPPPIARREPPVLTLSVSLAALAVVPSSNSASDEDQPSGSSEMGDQARRAEELLNAIRGPSLNSSTTSLQLSGHQSTPAAGLMKRTPERPGLRSALSVREDKLRRGRLTRLSTGGSGEGWENSTKRSERAEGREEGTLDDELRVQDVAMMEVSPATLIDLGKLGEGASGEVRKVRHGPTGRVMAKKVSFASSQHST